MSYLCTCGTNFHEKEKFYRHIFYCDVFIEENGKDHPKYKFSSSIIDELDKGLCPDVLKDAPRGPIKKPKGYVKKNYAKKKKEPVGKVEKKEEKKKDIVPTVVRIPEKDIKSNASCNSCYWFGPMPGKNMTGVCFHSFDKKTNTYQATLGYKCCKDGYTSKVSMHKPKMHTLST